MASRETIQGLAESLSAWSQTEQAQAFPRFSMLSVLPNDEGYLLLRVAYLGAGSEGTVAAAQGVLIDQAAMRAIGNNAHRLLPAIPHISDEEWDLGGEDVGVRQTLPCSKVLIPAIGNFLGRTKNVPKIALTGAQKDDEPLIQLLDSLRFDKIMSPVIWSQCGILRKVHKFDPAQFSLLVLDVGSQGADGADFTVANGRASPEPLRDAWAVLFSPTQAEIARGQKFAAQHNTSLDLKNAKLSEALSVAVWRDGFRDNALELAIGYTIQEIAEHGEGESDIFALLEVLAVRIHAIGDGEGQMKAQKIASAGLVAFFENSDVSPSHFGKLLDQWTSRIAPKLVGFDDHALRVGVEKGILAHVSPETLTAILDETPYESALSLIGKWLATPSFQSTDARLNIFPHLLTQITRWSVDNRAGASQLLGSFVDGIDDVAGDVESMPLLMAREELRRAALADPSLMSIVATTKKFIRGLLGSRQNREIAGITSKYVGELRADLSRVDAPGFLRANSDEEMTRDWAMLSLALEFEGNTVD